MKRAVQHCVDSFALETLEPRSMMAADLVPGGITLLYPGTSGSSAELRPIVFSVANLGNRRAPIGTTVRFYLSRDDALDSGDRVIRNSVLPVPVRPGENISFNKVLRLPRDVDGGYYHILMKVDADNHSAESDETNNTLPSASTTVTFAPRIGSFEVNKRFLRPGSAATLAVRNVTDMDPNTGEIRFYRLTGNQFDIFSSALLGVGTRSGSDFTLDFTADASWLGNSNRFVAVAMKPSGVYSQAMITIEGRNVGPTIGAFSFSAAPLVRGQSVTFTATGVSANTAYVSIYFDSNFDGAPQIPYILPTTQYHDALLADAAPNGSTLSITFTVPAWFPAAPSRVFIMARESLSMYQSAWRTYTTILSAQ